jgi:cytochrome c-type biogenesis protein CcmH
MTASTRKSSLPWSRPVLIVAATIAILAVGISVLGRQDAGAPPVAATGEQAPPDVGEMITRLEARLKEDAKSTEGWRMLGWSYFETGRYTDAARAYRKATELSPGQAELWSALGESLVLSERAGIPPDAVAAFEKALAVDPRDPRARFFMGAAKAEKGNPKGAIEDWIGLLKDSSPDAPWVASVRQKVVETAAANRIDVAERLTALPAPPSSSAASDAIPGPTSEQLQAAAGMTPGEQNAMAHQMVESLAGKLRADPRNPDGWMRLMRAKMVLGDSAGATQALKDARAAYAGDVAQQAAFVQAARALGVPGS